MDSKIYERAKKIWDYYKSFAQIIDYNKIVVCGSYDLRVCQFAIDLHKRNVHSPTMIFSGNTGNWTRQLWDDPEAIIFQNFALKNGITKNKILIENLATNLGENISFSQKFIKSGDKVLYITKPNTLLRLKLTLEKQLPGQGYGISAPDFEFPGDVSPIIGVDGVIHEMIGDYQRILEYPKLGFQKHHSFPKEIDFAYNDLVLAGYTNHLIKI
jgi:uncharacterized SAM-binding protein YcdF (DUF218 family)